MRTWLLLMAFGVCVQLVAGQGTTVVDSGPPGPGRVTKSASRPQGINSPVPAALASAHTLFLSNGGADAGLFPHPFAGTQDRGYGEFYKLVAANSAYVMAASPSEADLVLELSLSAPSGAIGGDKKHGTEDPLPAFKLTIYDRPTHYVLWTMSQTIDQANLQKTHDKNFDDALGLLVSQMFRVLSAGK